MRDVGQLDLFHRLTVADFLLDKDPLFARLNLTDAEYTLYTKVYSQLKLEAPVPDLVVLDLNLPRKDGREVLSEVKADPNLARIPVVIFTTSQASSDISRSYELGANCYLRKPGNLPDFVAVVQSMADFWLGFASLPRKEKR